MVGCDEVDDAGLECLPETLAVDRIANGRRAFVFRGSVRDLFRRKAQVMRTGFHRKREAFRASSFDIGQSLCAGKMNDVKAAGVLAAEPNQQANGFDFRLVRTGCKIAWVVDSGRTAEVVGVLGVNQQRQTSLCDEGHGAAKVALGHHRELFDSRMDKKGLEAAHSRLSQREKVLFVTANGATPELVIHYRPGTRRGALRFESLRARGSRNAVQWHVDDAGDPTRRSGS